MITTISKLIEKSLNLLWKITEKRKSIMELSKTIRYNGLLQIVELKKELNRINIYIEIRFELDKL